jgi:hypothetical protein
VNGGAPDKLLAERRLPTLTGLRIEANPSSQVVDRAEVASVSRLVRSKSGQTAGLLIGLAVDLAVVASASAIGTGPARPRPCVRLGYRLGSRR